MTAYAEDEEILFSVWISAMEHFLLCWWLYSGSYSDGSVCVCELIIFLYDSNFKRKKSKTSYELAENHNKYITLTLSSTAILKSNWAYVYNIEKSTSHT